MGDLPGNWIVSSIKYLVSRDVLIILASSSLDTCSLPLDTGMCVQAPGSGLRDLIRL